MRLPYRVIDSHVHIKGWNLSKTGDAAAIIDAYQEELGLEAVNLCGIPLLTGGSANNIWCALYKLHNPTAYAYGGLVWPKLPAGAETQPGMDPLTQYEELMEIGFDGIKLLETKTAQYKEVGLQVSDPCFEPFFKRMEEDGTGIVWHAADPETFWHIDEIPKEFIACGWYYGDGTYATQEEIFRDVLRVLERHPKLHARFAHFFFMSGHPERLAGILDRYENVGVDITPGSEMYADFDKNHDYYREFFIRYADRIGLGTDVAAFADEPVENLGYRLRRTEGVCRCMAESGIANVNGQLCKGLDLPGDVCRKIFRENFVKMTALKPKKIDVPALKRYIAKYSSFIRDAVAREQIEKLANRL